MAKLEFEFIGIDQNFRSSASNVLKDIEKIKSAFSGIGVGIGVDLKTALDGQKVALNDTKIQTQELVKAGKELDNQNKQTRNSIAELTLEQKKLTAEQIASRANLQDSPYSKLSRELNEMRNEAKNLGAQMILLDSAGMKSGVIYNTLANKFNIAQKSANSLDIQVKKLDSSLGQNQRNVGNYQQAMTGANGVTMEFNRIVQDAPYGMMGIGNNIQQLAENWKVYTAQAKAAAVANGTTVTTMGLVKGALAGIFSPLNLLSLGVAAVTSGWVLYEKWQQKANKASKEAKDEIDKLKESLSQYNQVMAESEAKGKIEQASLNRLISIYKDVNQSQKTRKEAYQDIMKMYESYFGKMSEEEKKAFNLTDAYNKLTNSILKTAKARAFQEIIEDNVKSIEILDKALKQNGNNLIDYTNKVGKAYKQNRATSAEQASKQGVNPKNIYEIKQAEEKLNETTEEGNKILTRKKALERENLDYEQKILDLTKDGAKVTESTNDNINKGNIARATSVKQLKEQIDYLKELRSLSGVSEKDFAMVGKVGIDAQISSLAFDFNDKIKQIEDFQQKVLNDTTLTESKRAQIIAETNKTIQYLMGEASANMKDVIAKNIEALDKMQVKAVKTIKDVEIVESPKQKQGRNREDDKDWKDYANILNQSVNSIFTNLKSNIDEFGLKARSVFYTLGETLGDLIKQLANKNTAKFMEQLTKDAKSFSDLKDNWKNMSSQYKWSAGLGFSGSAVSSLTPQTSSGGQAIGGALSGAAAGTAILPGWGTAIGAVVGGISGIFGAKKARKQERLQQQQLEEQKKANRLLERMNALTYASQIIGQKTEYGIVSGVRRNEFGQIVSVVQGQDIIMVADRANNQKNR